ncbi:MAG TPA: fused MFS/spermidine synthase [Segeticoccus sp.]|uniref:spermidine synthase n=1 Tax=Segeticoccus sp. TaxID=2706531 RepID=UPI002D8096ED|nr:fused MFS/spermidine synthase [Segeticoccus sp.]HET8599266.1 fused MFS/spermidine synthase [Segeticoccus sp.]
MSEPPRIELVPDRERGRGTTVVVNGAPQSHVDLSDPAYLLFEYVQHLAAVIDTLPSPLAAPPTSPLAGPLAVTHVGGAGLTLPRWINAERPGSPQIVLEPDTELTEVVRRDLPLPRRHRIRVRPQDGRTGLAALRDASADVVVVDAFAGGRVPPELTTVEMFTQVRRVLRPDGVLLLNVADEPGMRYAVRLLAGLRQVLGHVAVVATHEVLKGKRFGNLVAIGSGGPIDVDALRRRVTRSPFPTGVRDERELAGRLDAAVRFTDADASWSPEPPPMKGWRLR